MKTLTGHNGAWVVVRRDVYADRELWDSLDEDGKYLAGARAVNVTLRHEAVQSHTSAGVVLKLPMRPRWRELQHVTRPGINGGRTENGVVGTDAAFRLGSSHEDFTRALARMRDWPRITNSRAALAVGDGGAANVGESLTRLLVLELNIGVPETQFEVTDGSRRAVADLRVGNHLFEFDGKLKYMGRERGGVDDRSPEEIVWAEKQREDWLRSLGWGVSRLIWADLFGVRREVTRQRLAREYLQTLRRYAKAA